MNKKIYVSVFITNFVSMSFFSPKNYYCYIITIKSNEFPINGFLSKLVLFTLKSNWFWSWAQISNDFYKTILQIISPIDCLHNKLSDNWVELEFYVNKTILMICENDMTFGALLLQVFRISNELHFGLEFDGI